ncbi:MAG: SURF1 family protein, partial [Endozoicomonas sp.]
QTMSPVSIAVAGHYEDLLYLPIKVSGYFVADQYFLLDNQVYQGHAGYELIMPFVTDEGQWLWVNRGWLPAGNREQMPVVHTDSERLTLSGILYQPLGKAFLLSDELWLEQSDKEWPKRIQAIDFARMALALNRDVKKQVKTEMPLVMPSFMVVLNKPQPGAEQYRSVMVNMRSEKHLGYAFQWFAMALVLAGLYGYHMVRSGKGGGYA